MKAFLSRWRTRATPGAASAAPIEIALALYTDVGPVRDHNEDCIAALNAPWPGRPGDRTALVALADGMGGHQAGELASRLAVEAAMHAFGQLGGGTTDRLHAALDAANRAVHDQSQLAAEYEGMGTTLVLFAPSDGGAHFAWVGDSRLYRWRDGALTQLTQDDTLVAGLLSRGLIDAADIAGHPDQSVLTQAVGTHATIPSPHVQGPLELITGDRYLMCSDGIHDVVTDADLALALSATTPDEALKAIHGLALRGGADDNLSIGVIHVMPPEAAVAKPATRRTRDCTEVPT